MSDKATAPSQDKVTGQVYIGTSNGTMEGFACIPNTVTLPANTVTLPPGVYDPPLVITDANTYVTVPKASEVQPYMSENTTVPDPIVVSRVLDYLRMCDSEYRNSFTTDEDQKRIVAEKDAKIAELTETNSKIQAENEDLKRKNGIARSEYDIMVRYKDEAEKKAREQFDRLAADYQTLQNHFDIIANGFSSLNTLIAQQHSQGNSSMSCAK